MKIIIWLCLDMIDVFFFILSLPIKFVTNKSQCPLEKKSIYQEKTPQLNWQGFCQLSL